MMGWFLTRFGRTALGGSGLTFLLVAAVAIAGLSSLTTYRIVNNAWKAKQADALVQAIKERDEKQEKLAKAETKLVALRRELRLKSDDFRNAVTGDVDVGNCRIGPDGMQAIVDKIRSSNSRRDGS